MSKNIEKLYSKVLIRVPSDYITTQRDGSLLIKCPSSKRSYTKKSKEIIDIPIVSETKIETTTEPKLKKKGKFEKGSEAAKMFMAMMREKRKSKNT